MINEYFSRFSTYLNNFHKNRENLYKMDENKKHFWKSWQVSTRVVDENLIKYFQNKISYEKLAWVLDLTTNQQDCFDVLCFQNYLNQKWIDNYNKLIWEINSKINEHNQSSWKKLPKLIELYKQILAKSDKENIFSFVDSIIEDDKYLENRLRDFISDSEKRIDSANKNVFEKLLNCNDEELWKIYFKTIVLKDISNKYLQNWSVLENLLPENEDEKKKKWWKKKDEVVSLLDIKMALENVDIEWFIKDSLVEDIKSKTAFWQLLECLLYDAQVIKSMFDSCSKILDEKLFWSKFSENLKNKEKDIKIKFKLNKEWDVVGMNDESCMPQWVELDEEWDVIGMTRKTLVKETIEKVLSFEQMLRYFSLEKWQWESKERIDVEFDSDFYGSIDEFYKDDFRPHKFFNAVRNYVTKKQYSTDKFKLNFDNPHLLSWWWQKFWDTKNAYILKKWTDFYLCLTKDSKISKDELNDIFFTNKDNCECVRYQYEFQKPDNRNTPRLFIRSKWANFAPMVSQLNLPINDIIEIYDKWLFQVNKKDPTAHKQYLKKIIDYFKMWFSKHPSYKNFQFHRKESEEYENIAEFYADVEKSCYRLNPVWLNWEKFEKLNQSGKIYLFKIHNKDFSESHRWYENLHTKYWKAIFDKQNLEGDIVYKLCWNAEIFFRPATVKEKKIKKLDIKNDWAIENKRFTEPKIMFHCPMTMNFVNKKEFNINDMVKEYAKSHKMNVIWIDRWEKNLLYYALIDQNWNILKQWDEKQLCTMNILTSELPNWTKKEVNYYEKLVAKEWNREEERVDWNEIENIKEM